MYWSAGGRANLHVGFRSCVEQHGGTVNLADWNGVRGEDSESCNKIFKRPRTPGTYSDYVTCGSFLLYSGNRDSNVELSLVIDSEICNWMFELNFFEMKVGDICVSDIKYIMTVLHEKQSVNFELPFSRESFRVMARSEFFVSYFCNDVVWACSPVWSIVFNGIVYAVKLVQMQS